tara:strand:+ start:424 stop:564 length:141 start_codon:yes stop_codon:yes gene_type:complete
MMPHLRQSSGKYKKVTNSIKIDLYSHVMGGMKEDHAATIANLLKRD